MTPAQLATWDQVEDLPTDATAVWPPNHIPSSSTDWVNATVHYLDVNGQEVNRLRPSIGAAGVGISTWQYDINGNVVMELTAANRDRALAASNTVATAQSLETLYHYTNDGVAEEWRLGPTHKMTVKIAGVATEVDGRTKTTTNYDADKPDTTVYHLPTSISVAADYTDSGGVHRLDTISQTNYRYDNPGSSRPNRGWELRKPTKVIVDPNDKALTTTTIYHDTAPVALEVRLPGYTTATAGHVRRYTYAGINDGSVESMGLLATKATSVASPEAPMPFHLWFYTRDWNIASHDESSTTGGSTTRRLEFRTYDAAARLSTSQIGVGITGAGTTMEPTLTTSYDTQGNVNSVTSTPYGQSTPTKSILSTYDNNGRLVSYQDASSSTTTYTYNIDGDLQAATDPHGTATYVYNARGLTSSIADTALPAAIVATYDNDDQLKTQTTTGVSKTITWNPAGNATDLVWNTGVQHHVKYDAQDRWISETNTPTRTQTFGYDTARRLDTVTDRAAGGACTTRVYAYDQDSNRTSLKTYPTGAGNVCSTSTTPNVKTSTYDSADRLTNAYGNATTHDGLGRMKTAGTLLTLASYFADDHPSVLTQGGVTQNYTEDPAGRTQTRQAGTVGAPVETYHYADDTDSPSWSESGTTWTRNVSGVDGDLLATKLSTGALTYQYTNLHGDVIGTGPPGSMTGVGTFDEFGNAQSGTARQYGWLGGPQRSTESTGGLIQMGQRTYLAPIGRFLQTDPIDGGSANDYDYTNQDPINQTDLSGECAIPIPPIAVACVEVAIIAVGVVGAGFTAKAVHDHVTAGAGLRVPMIGVDFAKKKSRGGPGPTPTGRKGANPCAAKGEGRYEQEPPCTKDAAERTHGPVAG